ncbi:MAG: Ig-like domain repeat protein, partial [Elusimicrobia bacterium]|nr:Ig-like domain repeat protein [Elusimicrobiota bacterium]
TAPTARATRPPAAAVNRAGNKYYGPFVGGAESWGNPLDPIRGTAADSAYPAGYQAARPSVVELRVRRSFDGNYWTGSSWTATANTWMVMDGTTTWAWNAPPAVSTPTAWNDNQRMTVDVRAVDLVGNVSATASDNFVWDASPPTVSIATPSASHVAAMPSITGTADDPLDTSEASGLSASVEKVQVSIRNNNTNLWWDGSDFLGLAADHDTGSFWFESAVGAETLTAGWSLASAGIQAKLLTGSQYSVNARAVDYAKNVTPVASTFTFVYDAQAPTATVTVPRIDPNLVVSQLGVLQGTAQDGVLLDRIEVRIGRNDGFNDFWDPGDYDSNYDFRWGLLTDNPVSWFPAAGTLSWSTGTFPSDFFRNGKSYQVQARAVDKAGNISAVSVSSFSFTTLLPRSFVVTPSTRALSAFPGIAGTAIDDNAAVSTVSVAIKRVGSTDWWNDATWVSAGSPFWRQVTVPGSNCSAGAGLSCAWNYVLMNPALLVSGNQYQVMSISSNTAGKVEEFGVGNAGTGRDFTFTWDTQEPDSKVQVPAAGATLPSVTAISGTVGDQNPGAGLHDPLTLVTYPSSMTLSIREIGPSLGAYWNGGGTFTLSTEQFYPVTTLVHTGGNQYSWSLTSAGNLPTFASGRTYRIRTRGVDIALPTANSEATPDQRDFNFETSEASATILSPVNFNDYNALSAISGTAADQFGVKVVSVTVQVKNGDWWNGVGYPAGGPQFWFTAALTDTGDGKNFTWSFSSTSFNFADNVEYSVGVRVENNGGLLKVGQSSEFLFDTTPPTAGVTAPTRLSNPLNANAVGFYLNSLPALAGTAADSGIGSVGQVQVKIQSIAGDDIGKFWDGSGFNDTVTDWRPTNLIGAAFDKNTDLPPGAKMSTGSVYEVEARAIDQATNQQTILLKSTTFTYDPLPPTVALSTPANDVSVTTDAANPFKYCSPNNYCAGLAAARGTASDNLNVRKVEYRLQNQAGNYWNQSNDAFEANDALWIVATGSSSAGGVFEWTGSTLPNFAVKTQQRFSLQARSMDSAGNVLEYSTATFVYDRSEPVSVTTNVVHGSTIAPLGAVHGTATDGSSPAPGGVPAPRVQLV